MMKKKTDHTLKELQEIAKQATERAWNENFALGLPIVIEEKGNIIRKYKDGTVKVIKRLAGKKNNVEHD